MCKRRLDTNALAADFFVYVDDVRPTGNSEDECWATARRVASVENYLGIQDASRKRWPPSQQPGAWAGLLITASQAGVGVLVSVERWRRTQEIISSIEDEMSAGPFLLHKPLERARGFLVYIARTYPTMIVPYLKGIHLTLEMWQGNQDANGWKHVGAWEWEFMAVNDEAAVHPTVAPVKVQAAGRLGADIQALVSLTSMEFPPT